MIEVFLLSSLDAQSAPAMSHFSFKVQKLPIFKVLNLRKDNFNRLALWYLRCTIPRPKFEREFKKSIQQFLSKVEIFNPIWYGGGGVESTPPR